MTSNLSLRLAQTDDIDAVHVLLSEPEVYKYLGDGVAPPPAVAEQWVNESDALHRDHGGGLWILQASDASAVLGLVLLGDYAEGRIELTYVLQPSVWGQGLATRMAHTAMTVCFAHGTVSTIWAGADAPNTASIAVMERLGMRFWRHATYPAGPGVEYELEKRWFDPSNHEALITLTATQ